MTDGPDRKVEDETTTVGTSVVHRVQQNDQSAWEEIVEMYYPKIYGWCRASGLDSNRATDVTQDVFRSAVTSIHRFSKDDGNGSLGAWLRVVTRRRLADFFARQETAERYPGDEFLSQMAMFLDETTTTGNGPGNTSVARAIDRVRSEFEVSSWLAFWRVTIEGQEPGNVAEALGISRNAVYLSKSRIMKRLRAELASGDGSSHG